ncbi:hypothetical protein L1987_14414 [Smallanthus sonchifolius]|uniref:Uncharacterized protein n=1 Tax=Smallanthus sonchifolius TaxID=185202 RepID=A0ACB9J3C9_9ASTR|nr:hypothetical protein L1987_14414 [Smallanthus sonchifolius]
MSGPHHRNRFSDCGHIPRSTNEEQLEDQLMLLHILAMTSLNKTWPEGSGSRVNWKIVKELVGNLSMWIMRMMFSLLGMTLGRSL